MWTILWQPAVNKSFVYCLLLLYIGISIAQKLLSIAENGAMSYFIFFPNHHKPWTSHSCCRGIHFFVFLLNKKVSILCILCTICGPFGYPEGEGTFVCTG